MSASQETPPKVEDIRAEVVNGIKPLNNRPELRVTDPAFVDPMIAAAIARGGKRADIIWHAQTAIESQLVEPDGLAQIEKLIAAHYANPEITKSGDVVTVDVGVVEAKLGVSNRFFYLKNESPTLDNGKWRPSELAKFLKLAIAKYPGAAEYDVTIVIPQGRGSGRPDWKYQYFPAQGIIKVPRPDFRSAAYVLKNVSPDLSTLTSVSASDFKNE